MTERIALVTGGSRGLGKNAALKLADKGVGILLTWNRSQQEALEVVREIELKGVKAAALQLNVGEVASFDAFTGQVRETLHSVWQRNSFDYLLNNAGVGLYAPYVETTEAQFDEVMNIHFKGPFFLTQRLLPLIKKRRADPECLLRSGAFCPAGLQHLRGDERGDGSAYPLSGKRAGGAWDHGQYYCSRRH